jgi:mevalonate kinase
MTDIFYPSKLLLFGEHTVLRGSQALAMPLGNFAGRWQFSEDKTKQYDLPKLVEYVKNLSENGKIAFDTEGSLSALAHGLFFDSNIPRGYGAGSSGALVAALYDVFGMDKTLTISELKIVLGKIESFFHGESSGLDPLVSYLKKPILIRSDKSMTTLESVNNDLPRFLLDTKQSRKTEPLVKIFLEKTERSPEFNNLILSELVPLVDDAIAAFLQNQTGFLFETMHRISLFQHRFLPEMIPMAFKNVWLEGLVGDVYKLKLCGAGGGGFILGFCKNFEETKKELAKSGFSIIPI